MSPRLAVARLRRSARILRVALRYRLDDLIRNAGLSIEGLPFWARGLLLAIPSPLLPRADAPAARRLRLAFEDLGPVFVKFGQALSTRPDIIPAPIAGELAKLQDRVPPHPEDRDGRGGP